MDHALSFFDNIEQYPIVYQDKARNYTAYQALETGGYITIADWYVPGFTEEHWNKWKANPAGINDLMNERITAKLVNSTDGYKTYYYKMRMPLFISTRYLFTTFYYTDEDKETGWRSFIDSSDGNDAFIAEHKSEIGKDTAGYMHFNLAQSRPYDGGMQLRLVAKLDFGGYLPGIVKKFVSAKLANFPVQMADYLMKGEIPPDIFFGL